MDSRPCQAFIVPSVAMDYLYHPVVEGWSIWDNHWLDSPFLLLRGVPHGAQVSVAELR